MPHYCNSEQMGWVIFNKGWGDKWINGIEVIDIDYLYFGCFHVFSEDKNADI